MKPVAVGNTRPCWVLGAGLVGLWAAWQVARNTRMSVCLLDPQPPSLHDPRTLVLSTTSVGLLQQAGLWQKEWQASPIAHTHVLAPGLRKPWVVSHPEEAGRPVGYAVPYGAVVEVLHAAVCQHPNITVWNDAVSQAVLDPEGWQITTEQGRTGAPAWVLACDGKHSPWAQARGHTPHREAAIGRVCVLEATVAGHAPPATAYELLFPGVLVALVPKTPQVMVMIWMQDPHVPMPTPEAMLVTVQQARLPFVLQSTKSGHTFLIQPQEQPLRYGHHYALLGDAARVLHPIAAQGLNLHLWEAASWVQHLQRAEQHAHWPSAWAQACAQHVALLAQGTKHVAQSVIVPRHHLWHRWGLQALRWGSWPARWGVRRVLGETVL